MPARPPIQLTIEGQGLAALQRKLKTLPNRAELTRELNKGLREGARPLPGEARDAARQGLPKTGGLADDVAASTFGVRVQNGRTAGVSVYARKGRQVRDLRATDRGLIRHPVFGRWVPGLAPQKIAPGWFSNRMRREAPRVRSELLRVLEQIAEKAARA